MNPIIADADFASSLAGLGLFTIALMFIYGLILLIFPIWVIVRLDSIHKETRIQNKLTRQLLKAYGHEPEA